MSEPAKPLKELRYETRAFSHSSAASASLSSSTHLMRDWLAAGTPASLHRPSGGLARRTSAGSATDGFRSAGRKSRDPHLGNHAGEQYALEAHARWRNVQACRNPPLCASGEFLDCNRTEIMYRKSTPPHVLWFRPELKAIHANNTPE